MTHLLNRSWSTAPLAPDEGLWGSDSLSSPGLQYINTCSTHDASTCIVGLLPSDHGNGPIVIKSEKTRGFCTARLIALHWQSITPPPLILYCVSYILYYNYVILCMRVAVNASRGGHISCRKSPWGRTVEKVEKGVTVKKAVRGSCSRVTCV